MCIIYTEEQNVKRSYRNTLIDIFFLNQPCEIYFRELSTSDAIVGTFIMKG